MGTTDPLPTRVRELAAENEAIKAENGRLQADQNAALELIGEQESKIVALTGQVIALAGQVAAVTPGTEPPPAEEPAAPAKDLPGLSVAST